MSNINKIVSDSTKEFEHRLQREWRFGPLQQEESIRTILSDILSSSIDLHTKPHWRVSNVTLASYETFQSGLVPLGSLLSEDSIADIHHFLSSKPTYNTPTVWDSDGKTFFGAPNVEQQRLLGYTLDDILDAPHLLELANHPLVISTVSRMLRCPPQITLMSCWWAQPVETTPISYLGQKFHRDADGLSNCALFVYLTPVTPDSGPHQYIRNSNKAEIFRALLERTGPIKITEGRYSGHSIENPSFFFQDHSDDLDTIYEQHLQDQISTIIGPAGTSFITDTFGIHRGLEPQDEPRLIYVVRYGTMDNVNHDHRKFQSFTPKSSDKLKERLGDNFNVRYVNQHLFNVEEST